MGEIVVKDNVRFRAKDAERADVVGAVQTKVPVAGTDAWAEAQVEEARAALQAELDAARDEHEKALEARRVEVEAELQSRREAVEAELEQSWAAAVAIEADAPAEEEATKVAEPEVTKVREPSTTKRRGSGSH